MKRGTVVTVAMTALAGALLLFGSGRTWGAATVGAADGARQHVSVTGHDVAPALSAIGLALLAMSVALLAARGPLRRIGGLIVVAIGAAALAGGLRARNDVGHKLATKVFASSAQTIGGSRAAWWLLVVIAGAVAVVAGAATTIGAGGRGGLGSRYDAPSAATKEDNPPADVWDAIEQGQDPTVEQ
jgi:hypothetical protein